MLRLPRTSLLVQFYKTDFFTKMGRKKKVKMSVDAEEGKASKITIEMPLIEHFLKKEQFKQDGSTAARLEHSELKGFHCLATREIKAGELIFADNEYLDYKSELDLWHHPHRSRLWCNLPFLLQKSREAISDVDWSFLQSLIKTNTFATFKLRNVYRIFINASRLNHSCDHNATLRFADKHFGALLVYAHKDISAGEEICISYFHSGLNSFETGGIPIGLASESRRTFLMLLWNFDCFCVLCDAQKLRELFNCCLIL